MATCAGSHGRIIIVYIARTGRIGQSPGRAGRTAQADGWRRRVAGGALVVAALADVKGGIVVHSGDAGAEAAAV